MTNSAAKVYGASALAAMGPVTKVLSVGALAVFDFLKGFQPVAGFNWGAKRYDRVLDGYRFAARTAVIGAVAMGLLLAAFAQPLIGLFAKAGHTGEMREIGALCIRLQCLALPVHGWVAVVNMFCAGLGNAKGALLLSTSRQGTCFLPIVYPMSRLWGANGAAAVQAVADVLTLILAVPLIRRVLRQVRAAGRREEGGG